MATFYSIVKYTEEGSYEVYHIIKQKTSASKRLFQKQQTGKIVSDPTSLQRPQKNLGNSGISCTLPTMPSAGSSLFTAAHLFI